MIKGKLWSPIVDKLSDLNFDAKDKVIKVEKLDEGVLIKAEVIGVKGIICLENESDCDSEIPIKKINKDEWDKLR
jgi:hypothetical protein